MNPGWREATWRQFGAAIDMLERAVDACPDALWGDRDRNPQFWYVVFHTLFWLDLYLSETNESFRPPPPFTLDERDPAGLMPERVYTKAELKCYLAHGRARCRDLLASMSEASALEPSVFPDRAATRAELIFYNLRHVQHHTGQLNLMLRQTVDDAPRWVMRAQRVLE